MTTLPIIENFSIVAPLGLCFHDAATGERVLDGLQVSACPQKVGVTKNKTSLLPNRSGVYVLQKIKELEEFSRGKGDDAFWQENTPDKTFVIEVFDLKDRFQSFEFSLKLPVRGIYSWENAPTVSPNYFNKSIPLYSAPSRRIPAGMAVVRAELRDTNEFPASFAVLEARFEGNLLARGIADRAGKIVLVFPSLAPQSNPIVSPPATSTRVLLADQIWDLDFTVKYQPSIFQTSPMPLQSNSDEEVLTDLRFVLAQAQGKLWANDEQTTEFTTAVLKIGRELILRSQRTVIASPMPVSEAENLSFLYVSPAI